MLVGERLEEKGRGTHVCEDGRVSPIVDFTNSREQPPLRRLIDIGIDIVAQKRRVSLMHIQPILRPIMQIHEPKRLIPPTRNLPLLPLRPVTVRQARLRPSRRDLVGGVAHAELLLDAGARAAQAVPALGLGVVIVVVGGGGLELPEVAVVGPHGDGARVGVGDLQVRGEGPVRVDVDALLGDLVPGVGVEVCDGVELDGGGV